MALLEEDLGKAGMLSLPVTVVVLLLAFGAVVAAFVPLLLGLTSVAAAMGRLGVVSQFAPDGGSTGALVLLVGLAVGVDYSLFYIRREREERARRARRRRPRSTIAAATAGRAIVVSGLTVMLSLAGLLITGLSVFTSMALGTIIVVAFAVLGSLTVLPATLALLGDRVDRGRLPFARRRRARRGVWPRVARRSVTRRPAAWLITSVCVLGALAVPALELKTGENELPGELPVVQTEQAIERAFPGAPEDAELVVTGTAPRGGAARGCRRSASAPWRSPAAAARCASTVARDARTAVVAVPMPDRSPTRRRARSPRCATTSRRPPRASAPGAEALVTGVRGRGRRLRGPAGGPHAARAAVRARRCAFVLLRRRVPLARAGGAMIALNLLSLGATYGILAAVFQHEWAEGLLGFESNGVVTDVAAAVRVRDPVRALDGLHDPRARADARGAARRAPRPRRGRGGRRGDRRRP